MPTRSITLAGRRWQVMPSGRVTQYDRDEFALLFVSGSGADREVRVTQVRLILLGRRDAHALIASVVLVSIGTGVRAEPDPARAAEFIQQAGKELASVVGDASTADG